MFKGTPLKNRNRAWHIKHMARLKKRKAHRHNLMMIRTERISKNKILQKKIDSKERKNEKLLEKELERGKLYWFFMRWRGRIASVFNKVANKIKSLFKKPNATKAEA